MSTTLPPQNVLSFEQQAGITNNILAAFYWISPILNTECGKSEPPDSYKRDGLLAYADGVNWLPNGTGTKGMYRYNSSTSLWVSIEAVVDVTFDDARRLSFFGGA